MSSNHLWEYLDFMSAEAKLYIKGKYRYKTKFGLIMSILSFVPVVVLSIILFGILSIIIFLRLKIKSLENQILKINYGKNI